MAANPLGIEFLSVFGLPPVEFVHLAADLGCTNISTGLTASSPFNPHGYSAFSLREDAALRRTMTDVMAERGVTISLGEGFAVRSARGVSEMVADLDLMAKLGAQRVNTLGLDGEQQRCFDDIAMLVELAAQRGMQTVIEFAPNLTIGDLPTALAAVKHVGRPEFTLLIDTMHFARTGATAADLAAVDPALIGYVQICDVPMPQVAPDYFQEAMFERLAPGEGDVPLADILAAVPSDVIVSLEIPERSKAEAGLGPGRRLAPAIAATRALFS